MSKQAKSEIKNQQFNSREPFLFDIAANIAQSPLFFYDANCLCWEICPKS